ncbi:MAG: iron-sulfur cluster assembly accessory protein [Candidatus Marinimicrobia bacterium]|jgi:iron-sulfur cluster assembly protein|nr:iron-sulfur cluster assembly accessory protein [Candidatus Neomarinimicrobiota bacterium]MBT3618051.1 iron-sulfur cluster assembly accessory protein [Candidatus Neomarinimicrobiota bacterium]MBT3828492.1 iron-sulfur cluster assembly accessory protein [Candidatus Neomarinimicrobiota bacterium]MBT3998037.1 iron-sulfur cluster assembly accessory protein [Candidatus Neomarinimicrobiota bacterium]MBT4280259.1 iron-sulfur cluster assembly accessory protein [Candidatus Neomarinimicrobiota bacterium
MEKTKNQIAKNYTNAEIVITDKAAKRLKAVMESEEKPGHALRLSVVGGGCSGMSYNMSFESEQKEFDKVFESNGVTIYCDLKSYLYLKGVVIDFSNDMLSGGFQIKNPNAERTCGCGTSFSA